MADILEAAQAQNTPSAPPDPMAQPQTPPPEPPPQAAEASPAPASAMDQLIVPPPEPAPEKKDTQPEKTSEGGSKVNYSGKIGGKKPNVGILLAGILLLLVTLPLAVLFVSNQ